MSDNFLNKTGLQYYHNRIKTVFATKDEVPTKTSDLDNDSDFQDESQVIAKVNEIISDSISSSDTDSIASKDYVDTNGGKIDKIKVNGTEQTITNKEVSLVVDTIDVSQADKKVTWTDKGTTDNSASLEKSTNGATFKVDGTTTELVDKTYADGTFRTEQQVQDAIDDALADITGIDFQVVDTLPATGKKGVIYLVKKTGTTGDIYDEYIWIEPQGQTPHFEQIGTTDIDLSDYWSKTELVAITTAEIDTLFA